MGKTYKYGIFGVGRIGKAHASIAQNQGHQIVAIGDDVQDAVLAAQDELEVSGVRIFLDPALMAQMAYRRAHQQFREDIESGAAFAVTQNEVLDAQVFAEAAHRSAQYAGARYRLQRDDDLQEYKASCIANGLIDSD
ncbi:MAG: hypothetical protein ACREBD_10510 [Blastocatellia bacterium]